MHHLAFVNQKGGCGKTTTALHLAGALAAKGARPLLVDLDPQAHATLGLGIGVEDEPTVADVLIRDVPLNEAVVEAPGGIFLLPSSLALGEFEEISARSLGPERTLAQRLRAAEGAYDFVLLDCPPRADGVLTANALRAANTVCLVVETGTFALQGAYRALEILEELLQDDPAGEDFLDRDALSDGNDFDLRVVATLYDRRTRLARELLVALQARFGNRMFETVVHESVRLRQAAAAGLPVQVLDPRCRSVSDFDALADEVLALPADTVEPRPHSPSRRRAETARPPYTPRTKDSKLQPWTV